MTVNFVTVSHMERGTHVLCLKHEDQLRVLLAALGPTWHVDTEGEAEDDTCDACEEEAKHEDGSGSTPSSVDPWS